ncbi:MAG: rod shape-determining protein [Clostridia bacterium]|nr:rod shape-determining protein [Clostridia bacterium]
MSQYTAVLDIGSSKIVCLICSPDGKGRIVVHGAGICEHRGYKQGELVDEPQFTEAIINAINQAEKEAKRYVKELSVGVPAPFVRLVLNEGTVKFREGEVKYIDHEDMEALINSSLKFKKPEGYELMHSTPVEFRTDDVVSANIPLGATADKLSATVSHLFVDSRFKHAVSSALDKIGLDADLYIGVPLSSGIFVIPDEERAKTAILIDVGAMHTDISVVQNSALIDLQTIDLGGWHFANDLSFGLKLDLSLAESVKRRYVYSLDYQDSIDTIRIPGEGAFKVEHEAIQYIVEERTNELIDLIAQSLDEMGVALTDDVPVYLTGGGIALMRGSCEYMERAMGVPVKMRMPWMPRLSSPNYASAFSVIDFVMHASDDDNAGKLQGTVPRQESIFELIIKKIKSFFSRK